MPKLNVVIIGLGEASKAHEGAYEHNDKVSIVATVDSELAKAKEKASKYNCNYYSGVDDLLNSSLDIDIADVTVPHIFHYEIVKKLIEHHINVIVEKPFSNSYKEAVELLQLAKKLDVYLMVAENTRFVKMYEKIQELLRENAIGNIWNVSTLIEGSEVTRLSNPNNWNYKKINGGLVLDAGVHTFYLYKWLFGGVKEIKLFTWNALKNQEVEDNAVFLGLLENGAHFIHRLSNTAQKPWTERIEIYGSDGTIFGDQLLNPPLRMYKGSGMVNIEGGYDEYNFSDVPFNKDSWKSESMEREVNEFIKVVLDKKPLQIHNEDAAYAVKVVEMARKTEIKI